MVLPDHKHYQREPQADKTPCLFVGKGRKGHSQVLGFWVWFFFFLFLPVITEATAAFFIKRDYTWVMLISESKPSFSNASHYLLKSAVVIFRL